MGNLRVDVALTIAVSFELFIYGIYVTLFASTCGIIITQQSLRKTHSTAWIFRVAALATFILASLHISMELFRFLRAFVTAQDPRSGISYMYDFTRWTTVFSTCVFLLIVWICNALLVIRCYYVWNKNIFIIMTPILLQFALMATTVYLLYWLQNVDNPMHHLAFFLGNSMYRAVYAISLTQNLITSGLISLKIIIQRRTFGASEQDIPTFCSKAEVFLGDLIESASFYLLLNFMVTVLYEAKSNALYIFEYLAVPTAGILFLFIAIRVQTAKSSEPPKRSGLGNLRGWLATEDDVSQFNAASRTPNQPGVVSIRVSVENYDLRDNFADPSQSYSHKRNKATSSDSPL